MHKDIRLHGCIDKDIEYYAIVAGIDAHKRYFFNTDQGDGQNLRFFSPGNEFIIGREAIQSQRQRRLILRIHVRSRSADRRPGQRGRHQPSRHLRHPL